MKAYIDLLNTIIQNGKWKNTRTGMEAISISGYMFKHDISKGFPLLTTKKMSLKNIAIELEFFIKGLSDKRWLQERGCTIWNEWCNPEKVKYGHDLKTRGTMAMEPDLGRIYGVQWRDWKNPKTGASIDQLSLILNKLQENPHDRRMIVTAWNPAELDMMALPACHYGFQLLSDGKHLDLLFNMRSVDVPLGLPYNIASYGLLLLLIAKHSGLVARDLIGFLADCHIYANQQEGVTEQIARQPRILPSVSIDDDTNQWRGIFNWTYKDILIENYIHHTGINYPISV